MVRFSSYPKGEVWTRAIGGRSSPNTGRGRGRGPLLVFCLFLRPSPKSRTRTGGCLSGFPGRSGGLGYGECGSSTATPLTRPPRGESLRLWGSVTSMRVSEDVDGSPTGRVLGTQSHGKGSERRKQWLEVSSTRKLCWLSEYFVSKTL